MEESPKEAPQNDKKVTMLINCDLETGTVGVACSMLKDKIFCYGLLESAKLAIMTAQMSDQPKPKIAMPGGIMNFVRNKRV